MTINLQELANMPGAGKASGIVRALAMRDTVRKGYSDRKLETHLRMNYKEAWCKSYGKTECDWLANGFDEHTYRRTK